VNNSSILSDAFPSTKHNLIEFKINGSIKEISNNFQAGEKQNFKNSGFINNRRVITYDSINTYTGKQIALRDILQEDIPHEFYINPDDLDKWTYLKGKKQITRVDKSGYKYNFSEGSMTFPDDIHKASRTIITGEGGTSPSRFKHVIKDPITNKLRRLTPIELERLNMFPDNHTSGTNITNQKRAFFMGNALVIGVIEKIGISLVKKINYAELQPK
jgi:DNA (cytosine-5)-methyltransferase 1